jgi:hypothetical protein
MLAIDSSAGDFADPALTHFSRQTNEVLRRSRLKSKILRPQPYQLDLIGGRPRSVLVLIHSLAGVFVSNSHVGRMSPQYYIF